MKIFLSILFISFCSLTSLGQSDEPIHITWEDLEKVEYEDVYLDSLDAWFWMPVFSDHILKYDGSRVLITGYFQLISKRDKNFWLTKDKKASVGCVIGDNPMLNIDVSGCRGLRNSDSSLEITIEGKLRLNSDDVYRLNFILENPQVVKK